MGIQNPLLRALPDLFLIALAVLSQLYISRKLSLPKTLVWGVVGFYVAACLVISSDVFHNPPQPYNYYLQDFSALLTFYGWAADFAALVLWLRARVPEPFSTDRRVFLNTAAAAVCAAPVAALTAGIITRKDFRVKEIDVKVPGLHKDLNGRRLLQLSDIHMSAFFSKDDLRRVVDLSNGLRADAAFITGDLITGKTDPIDDCLLELKRLRAAHGLWGCMGNHERFARISRYVAEQGRKQGLFFLRREAAPLRFGDGRINLVGVDHQYKGEGYLRHMEDFVQSDAFNLLLSHNPDVFPVAARQGFQLTLSGHTHGGQINWEVAHTNINIVDLVTPFTKGLYSTPQSSLYVTSGLGTIGVPVRLGAPPEITIIRLCAS